MRKGAGNGLMFAGLIVTMVGLIIVVVRTFAIPGYWVPLLVGIALLVIGGAIRSAGCRRSGPPS